jgi:hypothetical protein
LFEPVASPPRQGCQIATLRRMAGGPKPLAGAHRMIHRVIHKGVRNATQRVTPVTPRGCTKRHPNHERNREMNRRRGRRLWKTRPTSSVQPLRTLPTATGIGPGRPRSPVTLIRPFSFPPTRLLEMKQGVGRIATRRRLMLTPRTILHRSCDHAADLERLHTLIVTSIRHRTWTHPAPDLAVLSPFERYFADTTANPLLDQED